MTIGFVEAINSIGFCPFSLSFFLWIIFAFVFFVGSVKLFLKASIFITIIRISELVAKSRTCSKFELS